MALGLHRLNHLARVMVVGASGLAAVSCGTGPGARAGSMAPARVPEPGARSGTDALVVTAPPAATEPKRAAMDVPRFLVHTEDGVIVERGATTASAQTLVPHADATLYDPSLELLWYIENNQLLVLDLRARSAAPALIVRDMKDMDRLTVMRGRHIVADRDGCESPYAVLEWNEKPKIKLMLADTNERVKIDGIAWLKAQLGRAGRPEAPSSAFGDQKVEVPASLLSCEDEESCATSVPFANRGWQLVMVVDRAGGDCWERACLLRDPKKDLFATPPRPQTWGPATSTTPGPCGPYRFDPSQSAYLVQRWLCSADAPCEDLGGQALGWLEPGGVVGEQ